MNLKHTGEEKQSVFQRYKNGESVASIAKSTGIPRSTVYSWIRAFSSTNGQRTEMSAKNFRLLQNKVKRFSNMKREELYRIKYRSEKEFIKAVDAYIEFYNFKRPHKKPIQDTDGKRRGILQ